VSDEEAHKLAVAHMDATDRLQAIASPDEMAAALGLPARMLYARDVTVEDWVAYFKAINA